MEPNKFNQLSVPQLLEKLNELYDKEEKLKYGMNNLIREYNQLQEDKELLQTIIMHHSNKTYRYSR